MFCCSQELPSLRMSPSVSRPSERKRLRRSRRFGLGQTVALPNRLIPQWRSSERLAIHLWRPRVMSGGWRCRPTCPHNRARPVNLNHHSEQANRLLHWEHRSSLLSLVPPFGRRDLCPAPPLGGTSSLSRSTGYVNVQFAHCPLATPPQTPASLRQMSATNAH